MMYSGDEECGDEITSGIFPDDEFLFAEVEREMEEREMEEEGENE